MKARTLRVVNVRPDHPAQTRQHNNQGERYRDEGAVSEVRISVYGKTLLVEVREPRPDERMLSCNGCNAPNVSSVLEVGSRNTHPPHGGTGSEFRFCGECTRRFREVVAELVPCPHCEDPEGHY